MRACRMASTTSSEWPIVRTPPGLQALRLKREGATAELYPVFVRRRFFERLIMMGRARAGSPFSKPARGLD